MQVFSELEYQCVYNDDSNLIVMGTASSLMDLIIKRLCNVFIASIWKLNFTQNENKNTEMHKDLLIIILAKTQPF